MDQEKGVAMQNHRIRLRTYNRCIAGNKMVDWLIKNDKAAQRLVTYIESSDSTADIHVQPMY